MLDFYRAAAAGQMMAEAVATVVEHGLETVPCDVAFVPTHTGATARMLSRFKRPSGVVAASGCYRAVCQGLAFSRRVWAAEVGAEPDDWWSFARGWMDAKRREPPRRAILVAGPSPAHPESALPN